MTRGKLGCCFTIALITLCFNLGVALSADQNIYIDASAGEGGNGSFALPYNQLADIKWWTIGESDSVAIKLKRGEVWYESFDIKLSGTQEIPVVIEAYGEGAAPEIVASGPNSRCIGILKRSYITIKDLSFRNADNICIYINEGSHNIRIENNIFRNSRHAVTMVSKNRMDVHDVTIENCTFSQITHNTIQGTVRGWGDETGNDDGTIYALTVTENSFDHIYSGISIIGEEADVAAHGGLSPYEIVIEDNTISNTDKVAILMNVGTRYRGNGSFIRRNTLTNIGSLDVEHLNAIQLNWCRSMTVEENIIDTVVTRNPDGVGIILDWAWRNNSYLSNGIIVRKNIIRNCRAEEDGKGISAWKATNSKIYNNIIVNCSKGIKVANIESTGTKCYNNTIIGCEFGVFIRRAGAGTTFYNNIVYSSTKNGFNLYDATAPASDYNLVFNSGDSNYKGVEKGENSIELNPLFIDESASNFKLMPNSPAINAGISIDLVTTDFLNQPVPYDGVPDMGVYEWRDGAIAVPSAVSNLQFVTD